MKIFLLVLIPFFAIAQPLDTESKKILADISQFYENLPSFSVNFQLTLDLPEQSPEIQEGTLIKNGTQFLLKLEAQTIFSDGTTLVTILENNREVQLMSTAEMDTPGGLSPENIFSFYENEPYEYAVIGNQTVQGQNLTAIEFKPLDQWSEYSKIRMTVLKSKNQITMVEAFGKDGISYIFDIKDFNSSPSIDAELFTFNPEKYTGYHIEDLR
ncbi:MAG: LolA family protein [Saprospiraceae bacterium]|jgi:outer membrane lipoprotein-sorting protein